MSYETSRLLPPMGGDNLDTRVSSLRVMNNRAPSPEQEAELNHRFFLHTLSLKTSLVGLLTRDGVLTDGSQFRFVSNSGIHQVMIWPAGGSPPPPDLLGDWFRAIPTSDSFTSGAGGTNQSEGWLLPTKLAELTSWPTQHKAISPRVDHPGHVTWSNPDLKLHKKPLVVSWRGPRDRYAATTGHASNTGGGIVAHERQQQSIPTSFNVLQLAEDVFTDGPFVWISGHKINTGIPKVIAACLHQWDPSGHPGEFVLRVCADRTIASATRQMVVYDLVPTLGATGGSLKSFVEASTALSVKATYLAADNTNAANPGGGSPGAGKWDYWQRPHFNKSGTRLAMLICKVGADGAARESHAVSFDPTTWAIVDDFTASITVTDFASDFIVYTSPWTVTLNDEQTFFVACDFVGDTFVYVQLTVHVHVDESGESGGPVGPSFYAGTQDRSYTTTYTISHSVLGTLKTWVSTNVLHMEYHVASAGSSLNRYTGNFHWDVANATVAAITRARSTKRPEIAFIGDLSKATFAVGYPKETDSHYNMAGTLDVTMSSGATPPSVPVTASRARSFLVFDLYFDGVQIVTAGTGGFVATATESSTGGYNENMDLADQFGNNIRTSTTDTNGSIARYNVSNSPVGPPSYAGRFGGTSDTLRCAQYLFGAAPEFQQIAVHPEKAAAYVGAAFYKDNTAYGGTTPVPHGLELTVVAPGSTPDPESAAAYIVGAHSTLSAPVFTGLIAKSGKTT